MTDCLRYVLLSALFFCQFRVVVGNHFHSSELDRILFQSESNISDKENWQDVDALHTINTNVFV